MQNPADPHPDNTTSHEKENGRLTEGNVEDIKKKTDSYAKYMGAGFQLIAPIILGVLLGRWLDHHFHTVRPMYTIICSLFMIVVALYQFLRQFLKS